MNWKMILIAFSLAQATDGKEAPETTKELSVENAGKQGDVRTDIDPKALGKVYVDF